MALRALLVILSVVPLIFCSPASEGEEGKDDDGAGEVCPLGAEMQDCSGCHNSCQPPGTLCFDIGTCPRGCVCKDSGYLISWDRCVPPSECEFCPIGAEMSDCSGCQYYCQPPNTACAETCRRGCVCKTGGHLISLDRCVPPSECEVCPIGAELSNCSGCQYYCQPPNIGCASAVCDRGCVCKTNGYLINGNRCVPPSECEVCPIGAEMSECSGCQHYCQPPNVGCPKPCGRGCVCTTSGYLIKNDRCVPASEC